MAHDWSALFDPDVPGVVTATWGDGSSAAVHLFIAPEVESDGLSQIQRRVARLHGPTTTLAGLSRNTTLTIAGQSWRAVSQPLANEHGLTQIYLEAL
ncbi:MAG: hypothetical protein NHG36_07700 [Chromatiaceae bacterium]|nr:hypothetical protein [Candidatus Thioaporhodococcus sediminis]